MLNSLITKQSTIYIIGSMDKHYIYLHIGKTPNIININKTLIHTKQKRFNTIYLYNRAEAAKKAAKDKEGF